MRTGSEWAPSWSEWHQALAVLSYPHHLKRTITVALCVGSVFFAMNQLAVVLAGDATTLTWLKVGLTYLTPFCMSNFGILTATRKPRDAPGPELISSSPDELGNPTTRRSRHVRRRGS